MEDILTTIGEDEKKRMYYNARCLAALRSLSSFLFDRLLGAFSFEASVKGRTSSGTAVKESLGILANDLFSFRDVPPLSLLQSLFVFQSQDREGEPNFDMQNEVRKLLSRAEKSLELIRDFNRDVPLVLILRCTTRNMAYMPKAQGGGEDWFPIYRDYWKHTIEERLSQYTKQNRYQGLLHSMTEFFQGAELVPINAGTGESKNEKMPTWNTLRLSFLLTFYRVLFIPHMDQILRTILMDGDFYTRETRTQFSECYNDLVKIEDDIKDFERRISPQGDYFKRYKQAKSDMSIMQVKQRKIQMVLDEVNREVSTITISASTAMNIMITILLGILNRDDTGQYDDTLANLSKLNGKGNSLSDSIAVIVDQFTNALKLLENIEVLDIEK
jgi:hypothetical protein